MINFCKCILFIIRCKTAENFRTEKINLDIVLKMSAKCKCEILKFARKTNKTQILWIFVPCTDITKILFPSRLQDNQANSKSHFTNPAITTKWENGQNYASQLARLKSRWPPNPDKLVLLIRQQQHHLYSRNFTNPNTMPSDKDAVSSQTQCSVSEAIDLPEITTKESFHLLGHRCVLDHRFQNRGKERTGRLKPENFLWLKWKVFS